MIVAAWKGDHGSLSSKALPLIHHDYAERLLSGATAPQAHIKRLVLLTRKGFKSGSIRADYKEPHKHLFNLRNVNSTDDLQGLIRLHEGVHPHFRSSKGLGVDTDAHSVLLKTAQLRAFPCELAIKYNQHLLIEGSERVPGERRDDLSTLSAS